MMNRWGMEELIASDTSDYAEIVCQLASDMDTLRGLRSEMLRRFDHSPLTDVAMFTKEFGISLDNKFRVDWYVSGLKA